MQNLHNTANFTVFGGAYPAESHSHNPIREAKSGKVGPMAAVLVALIVGATTTAGAITSAERVHSMGYGFQTASYVETLGGPSLRELQW